MDISNTQAAAAFLQVDTLTRERNRDVLFQQQQQLTQERNLGTAQDQVTLSSQNRVVTQSEKTNFTNIYDKLARNATRQQVNILVDQGSNRISDTLFTSSDALQTTTNGLVVEQRSNPAVRVFEQVADPGEGFHFVDTFA